MMPFHEPPAFRSARSRPDEGSPAPARSRRLPGVPAAGDRRDGQHRGGQPRRGVHGPPRVLGRPASACWERGLGRRPAGVEPALEGRRPGDDVRLVTDEMLETLSACSVQLTSARPRSCAASATSPKRVLRHFPGYQPPSDQVGGPGGRAQVRPRRVSARVAWTAVRRTRTTSSSTVAFETAPAAPGGDRNVSTCSISTTAPSVGDPERGSAIPAAARRGRAGDLQTSARPASLGHRVVEAVRRVASTLDQATG